MTLTTLRQKRPMPGHGARMVSRKTPGAGKPTNTRRVILNAEACIRQAFENGIWQDQYLPQSLFPYSHHKPGVYIVNDTSMAPRFTRGDALIVATENIQPRNGDVVVVCWSDGTHTVKELKIVSETQWQLIPFNTADHRIQNVDPRELSMVGVVVGRYEPMWTRWSLPLSKRTAK